MINKNIFITITLVLLTQLYLFTGEIELAEEERVFYFVDKLVTFKNVCEREEITNFHMFINRNSFLFVKHQIDRIHNKDNGFSHIQETYPEYERTLESHIAMVQKYVEDLSQALSTGGSEMYNDSQMHGFQADYIKMLIKRVRDYVTGVINKRMTRTDPTISVISSSGGDTLTNFEDLSTHFDRLSESLIAELLLLVKEAPKVPDLKAMIEPTVCDGLITSALDVIMFFLETNGFDDVDPNDQGLLFLIYDELKIFEFSGYTCEGVDARKHLIGTVVQIMYGKPVLEIDPKQFADFLNQIIPHTHISQESVYKPLVNLDHDLIHVYENFVSITLSDIKNLKKFGKPTSIDFLSFIEKAEDKINSLNLNLNTKGGEDVPLEVFTIIYKLFLIARGDTPKDYNALFQPMYNLDGNDELKEIAKILFQFTLTTKIFDPVDEESSNSLTQVSERSVFVQLIDPIKFSRYRLIILIVLAKEFTDVAVDQFSKHKPDLSNIFDQLTGTEELIPINDYKQYFPDDVVDNHHGNQITTMMKTYLAKKNTEKKIYDQKSKKDRKMTKITMIEESDPELNQIVEFISVKNPKESTKNIKTKSAFLTRLVEDADNDFDKKIVGSVINKAVVTNLKSTPKSNETPDQDTIQKRLGLALVLRTTNIRLVNTLLEKINTPGLYQFLTYISTSNNMNDLKVLGNKKSSNYKERILNYTLDKLLFVHKWYELNKNKTFNMGNQMQIQQHLQGPSAQSKKNFSLTIGKNVIQGADKVYTHIITTETITKYFDSLKFMAELVGLFDEFSTVLTHNQGRIAESYRLVFVNMYNIILDMRSDDFDTSGCDSIELFMDKLHEIRDELLESHMDDNKEKLVTNKYSLTYKDVIRTSYFTYYYSDKTFADENLFVTQMEHNFGLTELFKKHKELNAVVNTNQAQNSYVHNKFDFGDVAFEASDFITFLYVHDREYIRHLCQIEAEIDQSVNTYQSIRLNGFCGQAMIFLRSLEFLSSMDAGNFESWFNFVFEDPKFKNYALQHKGIIFAAFEIINREANMLRTMHSEKLQAIIDEEMSYFSEHKGNIDPIEHRHFESVFQLTGIIDKSWLINYMYVNFEKVYTAHERLIFKAIEKIIENGKMFDYFITSIKGHYSDVELELKAFVMKTFRVFLLYTQKYEHFEKIADFLMTKQRSHLLIYLKRENDDRSDFVDRLLNEISQNPQMQVDDLVEIINNIFDEEFSKTIEACEDDFFSNIETEDLDYFGEIQDDNKSSKNLELHSSVILSQQPVVEKQVIQNIEVHQQPNTQELISVAHKKAVVQLAENNKIRDNVRIKAEIHDDDSLLNNVVIRIGLSDEDHVEITHEDMLLKRNNQRVTSSSISQGIRSSLVKKKPRNSNQSLQLSRSFIENTSQRQSSTEQSKSFDQLRVTLERSMSLTRKSSQKKLLI